MTNDAKTTVAGLVMACGIAGITYLQAGIDPSNPNWWAGMVISLATAVKGVYTNKPDK